MRGRALGVLCATALGLSGMVALAGPAAATWPSPAACGDVVTTSGTMGNSFNCPAPTSPGPNAGLIITQSGITVNLGGHTISCSNKTNTTSFEQVGILLRNVSNVTVKGGYVQDCDAGVVIEGGSGNTVTQMFVHDNINHSSLVSTPDAANNPCNFGDGIVAFDSSGNQITGNAAYHNGPFDGIALVDDSDNNTVSNNNVYNQTVSNELPPAGSGMNGPCGPFQSGSAGAGRLHQDIGIRVEGPGADNNRVLNNQATRNQLNGISIHGYVCGTFPGGPPLGVANTNNTVDHNTVRSNGFPDGAAGIGILRQGPLGTITCGSHNNFITYNTSAGNAGDGIFVTPTGDNAITSSNVVDNNVVNSNGRDGIRIDGPFTVCPIGQRNSTPPNFCNVPREPRNGANNNTLTSNRGTGNGNNLGVFAPGTIGDDGFDGNPACDQNRWSMNIFGTVNQPCVKANGGTGTVTGPIP